MKPDSPLRAKSVFSILVGAVAVVLLAVSAFVALTLFQSRQRYFDEADNTARNLSAVLDNALHSHFQEVDLALQRARREFADMHAQERFQPDAFSAFLRTLRERIPQADAVRGADASGMVVYGEGIEAGKPVDLSVREFYQRVLTERTLVFGVPVRSRITGKMVFPLATALLRPDGSFGGAAYVNMNSARISALTASLKIGPHGVITLVDERRRLLHRYPEIAGAISGKPMSVSPLAASLMDGGGKQASYAAASKLDGELRHFSVERVGDYPVFIVVGLAERDILAPWHDEVRNGLAFLLVVYLLSGALVVGVRMALRRQTEAAQALVNSERRFRSLTEGLPQMVWTTPDGHRFDFLSHHWSDYSGMTPQALARSGAMRTLMHEDDRAAVRALWKAAMDSGGEFRSACRLRRHDGAWRVFDNHALPQRDAGGKVAGWVGSSTDITEQREAQALLERTKDEALAAADAKSAFLANMSHEIRSPMNAVLGMLQLLQRTALDGVQRDYADKAVTSARALLGILNDILDFSKVEEGKLALDVQPFSVDRLLRELGAILSINADGKGIEVLFDVSPAVPRWLMGDALRLQQVLLNLAGNAIKFTERGEVVLSVAPEHVAADSVTLHVSVRDTGIGIAPAHLAHIFDGFSQAESSTARRFGGTGLGLAISQRLVRLMGGELRVRSAPGAGSTFDFCITLGRTAQQDAHAISPALQFLRCLVVDDSATGRDVMAAMVRSFGWRAECAASGEESLAALAARPFDIVLMDWRMPGIDGWETAARLRRAVAPERAPLVLMVTAHERELIATTGGKLAPVLDAMLAKPVTASVLFDTVAGLRLADKPAAAVDAPRQAPPARAADTRLAGLHLLVVDDNAVNLQVARELLAGAGAAITVAGGGAAAVDAVCDSDAAFDLILMDIQMPDMDGYVATAAIHARLGAAAPPIVAMTANAMSSDRDAAHAAGMAGHVGKPFELERLIGVIVRHARGAGAIGSGLNAAAALQRLGGSLNVYQMALRGFGGEMDTLTSQLSDAMEADKAVPARAALHTMRSLAGMVGAERLAVLIAQAERMLGLASPAPQRWDGVSAVLAEAALAVRAAADQLAAS